MAQGLVSYLAHTLALQAHLIGYLLKSEGFLSQTIECGDDLPLTLIQVLHCLLGGLFVKGTVDTSVGLGSISVDKNRQEANIGLGTQGRIE